MRWSDLRDARVGVWGIGTEGRASIRKLATMGVTPVQVDDRPAEPGILATAEGGLEALQQCDVVVKAPGISRYSAAATQLGTLVGGLGLWMEEADHDRVVCVTGTKGKSTTVSLIGHLLGRLGHACGVAGNIGLPPWDPDVATEPEFWAIETSSFQVTDLWSAPAVVAVTSLHPDHLDWHGSVERYFADKLSLCSKPGVRVVIANGRDERLRARIQQATWADEAEWTAQLPLRGEHNRVNASIAAACIDALDVHASDAELEKAVADFTSLPSRLCTIGTVGGVEFVDDSLSTNVLPAIAAVSVFEGRRVALIAGGYDRNIDYTPLAEALDAREDPTLVVALPDSGARICAALKRTPSRSANDLDAAVDAAFAWAQPDGVVLLSPASPSFGAFRDYQERSDAFARAMQRVM